VTPLSMMSARERRVVLGGLIVGAAVLGARIVPAWRGWLADTRSAAIVSNAELARARSGIAGMPLLRDSLVARNGRYLALAPGILTGTSSGAVGATLASIVSGAAAGAGLEVGAISIRLDTVKTSVFSRPSVRGDARGDIAGLTRFLVALERGPTVLVIQQLAVTQPEPGAADDRPESLRIDFTIEGIALTRAAIDTPTVGGSTERTTAPRASGGAP